MVAWVFALVHFQKRAASKRREFIKEKKYVPKAKFREFRLKTCKIIKEGANSCLTYFLIIF